ncbi:hypothetical protein [Massilia sp. METH4]|uniref:hypothetical protein n=1 Tax=Massilia sp. METH4 TaxID=3123041 RepID=UPI0030D27587
MKPGFLFCLAAALFGAAPAAALAAQASASLGPLTFILVDLDPADGISPSLTLSGSSGSAAAPTAASFIALDGPLTQTDLPTWTDSRPIQHEIERGTAQLNATGTFSLTGRESPTGALLAAAVTTQVLDAAPGLHALSRLAGDTGATAFTLSANTRVLFSVPYDVALSTEPPPGAGERLEAGMAAVWLGVEGLGGGYDEVRWLNHAPDGAGFLSVALENGTGFDQGGTLRFGADVQVESITAVPEPGMLPMLGVGLLVLAGCASRRLGGYAALSRFARRRRASFGSAISGR